MSPTIRRATSSAVFSGRPFAVAERTDTPLKRKPRTASIGFRPRIEPCRREAADKEASPVSTYHCNQCLGSGRHRHVDWSRAGAATRGSDAHGCSSLRPRGLDDIKRRRSCSLRTGFRCRRCCAPLSVPGGQGGQARMRRRRRALGTAWAALPVLLPGPRPSSVIPAPRSRNRF